jgi:hypothetical protein
MFLSHFSYFPPATSTCLAVTYFPPSNFLPFLHMIIHVYILTFVLSEISFLILLLPLTYLRLHHLPSLLLSLTVLIPFVSPVSLHVIYVYVDGGHSTSLNCGYQWSYCSSSPDDAWVWKTTVENIDRKAGKLGKNLSQCHYIHHKSHMEWPACEHRPASKRIVRSTTSHISSL